MRSTEKDQKALALLDHYEAMFSAGWQPTRWVHPELGVMERLPTGGWRNISISGVTTEYAIPEKPGEIRISNLGGKRVEIHTEDE